ncbi:MAG: RNA polymerase sigma factor RpoE [Candidatus Ruthia sp. Asou_11_S2]|nr:RNA polymerase sigma factor RpoE [Candidatus Ruthia sp. Asou_11_S2]
MSVISKKNDECLMIMIQKHHHQAFDILVQRHHQRFYAISYRMLFNQNDTQDIVQEAFLKLWNNPNSYQSEKSLFTTWFYRVIANLCLDYKKKIKTQLIEHIDHVADPSDLEENLEQEQAQFNLKQAIISLPKRQRLAIVLCFYENMSNKQAAQIMNIRLKALQSLLMRGKAQLKQKLNL